jgi:integrase
VFLRAAAGHRLFAAFWGAAFTGRRRNELLGLRWDDFEPTAATVSINRGLIAVADELHETRGKTRYARRSVDLDPTTVEILSAWRHWQQTEMGAAGIDSAGWIFTDGTRQPITLTSSPKRSNGSPAAPAYRSSDCTTCATPTARC